MLSKSNEKGKNFLRVYKDVFTKIFNERYGKDRLSLFLEL